MDQVLQVADVISRIGFPVVCAALVVIIFISNHNRDNKREDKRDNTITNKDNEIANLMKTMQSQYENTINLIQSQNDVLVKEIIHGTSTHTISDEDSKRLSEVDEEINNYLSRVLNSTNSDRAAIMIYHNGGNDALGNPFPKMSMRYERCKPGVPRIMNEMSNMFKSYLHELCRLMDNEKYAEMPVIDDIKDKYPNLYELLLHRGTKSLFAVALRNKNGVTNGFLLLEYLNSDNIDVEQVRHCLHDKQLKIEALLNIPRK